MNRRVRTSVLRPNYHGHYVGYWSAWENGSYRSHALVIFDGPGAGSWEF